MTDDKEHSYSIIGSAGIEGDVGKADFATISESLASQLPQSCHYLTVINDLSDSRLKLDKPLQVLIEEDPSGFFFASVDDFEIFAEGDGKYEVLDEIKEEVVSEYYFYKKNQSRLAGNDKKIWEYMKTVVIER